jgi:hypothetical protein
MFDKPFYERLKIWRDLRLSLETSEHPIKTVLEFWNRAPIQRIAADPYDRNTWPEPWEMIYENQYCEFSKILAIFYTLQLTDRFSTSRFEIHICTDREKSEVKYLLYIDNEVIGYYHDDVIFAKMLPTSLKIEANYTMTGNLENFY